MRAIIHGSGSGADLDVITAEASDVLAPKVIVDRDGEPMTGTLALSGNAAAGDVRQGRTFYTTNPKAKLTGTMAERGAATYTPGTSNQVIAANQYLTGAQTIRGDGNLASQYIKKGVTIFGVTGSWEGYVPTPTDLYLRGNNIVGFTAQTSGINFQSGMIEFVNGLSIIKSGRVYNFTGFNSVNIECKGSSCSFMLTNGWDNNFLPETTWSNTVSGSGVCVVRLNGYSGSTIFGIKCGKLNCFVYRIWTE